MSLNKFMGIGNLTRNVEVREVGQNKVARFAIAMNEKYRKQDGTISESTEYMEVENWGDNGIYPYLLKGQFVYVEGSIKTEKWTGDDGVERTTIKVRARNIQLLGAKPQAQQQQPVQAPQYQQPAPPRPQAPRPPQPQQRPPMPPQHQYQQPAPQQQYQSPYQPQYDDNAPMPGYGETYELDLPF